MVQGRWSRSTGLLCALLLAGAAPAAGAEQAAPFPWQGSLDRCFRVAKERKLPVLVLELAPRDPANATHLSLYELPEVLALSPYLVACPAARGAHGSPSGDEAAGAAGENERNDPTASGGPCPLFRTVTCAEHRAAVVAVEAAYPREAGAEDRSRLLFAAPGGRLIAQGPLPVKEEPFIARALSAIRTVNPEAAAAAARSVTEGRIDRFGRALFHAPGPRERRAVIRKLALTGDVEAFTRLYGQCTSEADRLAFIRCAAVHGPGRDRFVPWLCRILREEKGTLRNHAAVSLEEIASPDAVPALLELLPREKAPEIRKNLLRALGACGPGNKKVQAAVCRYLDDRDVLMRKNAYLAVHRMKGVPAVHRKVIRSGLEDKNPCVRACAAWALAGIGSKEDIPLLREKLRRASTGTGERIFRLVAAGAIQALSGRNYEAFRLCEGVLGEDVIPRTGSLAPAKREETEKVLRKLLLNKK